MTEPDQIEFHEHVSISGGRRDARSIPLRIGVVAGSALLLVLGAVAAMGASPTAPAPGGEADLSVAVAPEWGAAGTPAFGGGFRGGIGHGGFREITISAINGSSLSLETDDGWTRTIAVGSSTAITKSGATITVGELAVGDQIRFAQERADDGTYTITAIRVVLPVIFGEVTAVSGSTITVTGKDGTAGTIHVDGDTTYTVNGTADKALSDITVGAVIVAQGTLRSDGSLDADAIHSGFRDLRDGDRPNRGFRDNFRDKLTDPAATPTPSSTAS